MAFVPTPITVAQNQNAHTDGGSPLFVFFVMLFFVIVVRGVWHLLYKAVRRPRAGLASETEEQSVAPDPR